jgi:arylsulfatase A-like enzyme
VQVRAAQPERRRQIVDDEPMICVMRAKYFGAITHIEDQVGRLLAELRRLGMADNTLVLFTADRPPAFRFPRASRAAASSIWPARATRRGRTGASPSFGAAACWGRIQVRR